MKKLLELLKEQDPNKEPGKSEPSGPETPIDQDRVPKERAKSSELDYVSQKLSGETVKNATMELGSGGRAELSLELASTNLPAKFIFGPGSRIVFIFKNQPSVLRK